MRRPILLSLLILIIAAASAAGLAVSAQQQTWRDKVDPWVLETAAAGQPAEFLIFLSEQADLSAAARLESKTEKGAYVFSELTALAARTQAPLLAELTRLGVEHRPYWVANLIWARGSLSVIEALARRSDVARLSADPWVQLQAPEGGVPAGPEAIEWNILKVNADDVWAAGYTGQGAVIGGQDTGYDWDHPALKNQYRGWNGSSANHNYNWHDAIHENNPNTPPGNPCGFNSPAPCDDDIHGTHTMGTMVGDDGAGNQVGMAPGAKWIGCRNMEDGWGKPSTYIECYQWFLAPTDLNNQNPDPAKAPHVINNSWGCPPAEGCTDPNVMRTVVANLRQAGILSVHSAGNSGPACSTVSDPAAIYDESFSVGNTTSSDLISGSSSRGPVTIDGSGRLKPDISAPGSGIRSTIPGGGYTSLSGTSMAGPHVAGLVALLISAQPSLAGEIDLLESVIQQSALHLTTTTQTCGGIPGTQVPNNTYGWGRIDALAAYQVVSAPHTLQVSKSASPQAIQPGGLITYTLSVTHTHPLFAATGVVLSDPLPANTTFVAASVPYDRIGDTVYWYRLTPLAANASWTVQMIVRVNESASGSILNTGYQVYSDQAAAAGGPPVETPVIPYAIQLGKTASAESIQPGQALTYTLTAHNPHPFAGLHSLVLTDTLPAGTSLLSASQAYSITQNVVTWERPALAAGESWQVTLSVATPLTLTQAVENRDYGVRSAEVSAQGAPLITPLAVLRAAFDPQPQGSLAPGGVVTYTLHLTNTLPVSDTFSIEYQASPGWTAAYTTPLQIAPMAAIELPVQVFIPAFALPASQETLVFTIRSQSDPQRFTQASLRVALPGWRWYLPFLP
jgi:uncharacterized repeat protein (TIGR01451 family)